MHSLGLLNDLQASAPMIAASGTTSVFDIGLWMMAAVVCGIAGIYLVRFVRQWIRKADQASNFSLQDLRELRRAGQISDTELAALKGEVIRDAAELKPTDEPAVGDQTDGDDSLDDPKPDTEQD